jgi:hypothetical protein
MWTKTRSTATAQQRTEAVSNLRLLPRLSQTCVEGCGGGDAAGLLGSLYSVERSESVGNVGRVIRLNGIRQGLAGGFRTFQSRSRGNGCQAGLLSSQDSLEVKNLSGRQTKEPREHIDLPVNHLLWRWGRERAAESTARLRAENSRENH